VVIGPVALHAAEPATKSEATPPAPPRGPRRLRQRPPPSPATATDADVLPAAEDRGHRPAVSRKLDRAIKKLDKAIAPGKEKRVKASDLDKVLNNPKLTQAAAIFRGAIPPSTWRPWAASRVRYMEAERDLLSDMREPRTPRGPGGHPEKNWTRFTSCQRELGPAEQALGGAPSILYPFSPGKIGEDPANPGPRVPLWAKWSGAARFRTPRTLLLPKQAALPG